MRIAQSRILAKLEREFPYQIVFDISKLDQDIYIKRDFARTFEEAYEFGVKNSSGPTYDEIKSLEEAKLTSIVWESKSPHLFTSCFIKRNVSLLEELKDWKLSLFDNEILFLLLSVEKKENRIHFPEPEFFTVKKDWSSGRYIWKEHFGENQFLTLEEVVKKFFSWGKIKPKSSKQIASEIEAEKTVFTERYFQESPELLFVEMHIFYTSPLFFKNYV